MIVFHVWVCCKLARLGSRQRRSGFSLKRPWGLASQSSVSLASFGKTLPPPPTRLGPPGDDVSKTLAWQGTSLNHEKRKLILSRLLAVIMSHSSWTIITPVWITEVKIYSKKKSGFVPFHFCWRCRHFRWV